MAANEGARVLERGDIFFLYRPKMDTDVVRGRRDVQRFYMVLAPEHPNKKYRLFVIGRKKLPESTSGKHSRPRTWALAVNISENAENLRKELAAAAYSTKTRGKRVTPAAEPVGEGRYQLVQHNNHTEIVYALELPRKTGPAQDEFDIEDEASFIVSVKNPEATTPGATAPKAPPAYPHHLQEKFGKRRWIDVDQPELLDYENTQLLMIAAHGTDAEQELGIRIDAEQETLHTAEICRELRLECNQERVKPLLTGNFPKKVEKPVEKGTKTAA